MYSYHGKVLYVDLTTRTTRTEPLAPSFLRKYLGGVGLAVRLLYDNSSPGMEPFSPANPLVFASSGFSGTMVPTAAKHAVATKSPLTGFVGDSLSSSFWSLSLKRAGYDALVITGAAPSLTYLFIDDDIIHFRDAAHLAGKSCGETQQMIRRQIGDDRVRVAAIGQGGENRVRYACISNDFHRQAGRTGAGAVMGSKRLKAIALRGTRSVSVADLPELEKVCRELYRRSQGVGTEKYRVLGTPANVLLLNYLAALPTRNFQQSTFEGAEKVSGEFLYDHYLSKVVACAACPVACEHIYQVKDGLYAGTQVRVDYETLFALGPLCGVDDLPAIIKAAELCNAYGLDSISTGGCIAWAMECFERGLLTRQDTAGVELTFGNSEAVLCMIERIGRREGLGDLLAEGVRKAAGELGQGSSHWAMQVKGLELPGYEPRCLKTLALGLAVGTRGACHNRSTAYEVDLSGRVDRFKGEPGRGRLAMEQEDFAAVLDSLILCKFLRRCFAAFYAEAARLYTLVTGLEMSAAELQITGERITNLKKAFNIREGWQRRDDWLPPRFFRDRLPTGSIITQEELNLMIDDYYQARGWTREGLIPPQKLQELDLEI